MHTISHELRSVEVDKDQAKDQTTESTVTGYQPPLPEVRI